MIDTKALIACGLLPTQARRFAPHMALAAERFGINTTARIAAFVAQCRVESANFTQLEEGLFYRDADRLLKIFPSRVKSLAQAQTLVRNPQSLANVVYADRLGNGPADSGDGWRFRGRGVKQLTGRTNYTEAAAALGRPYVEQPDLVAEDADACLTAAWFWHKTGCSGLADTWQINEITRRVNGPGMLQASERRNYADAAIAELSRLA
mgnify:CR=1 FL=1